MRMLEIRMVENGFVISETNYGSAVGLGSKMYVVKTLSEAQSVLEEAFDLSEKRKCTKCKGSHD